jgi:superfamily I DNA/RNA helicase
MSFTKKKIRRKKERMSETVKSYATLTPLGRFPSMASFLLRQSAQRKGPCQGFELVEKIDPA